MAATVRSSETMLRSLPVAADDMPNMPRRPVGASTRKPLRKESPPTASSTSSTPRPPVISMVRFSKSSVR
jgi:hypothetical protein